MFDRTKYIKAENGIFLNIEEIKKIARDNNKCAVYKIPIHFAYRPDLIAYSLYKDVTMADFLAIINDIDDSPEGFYTDRIIKVLKSDYIGQV